MTICARTFVATWHAILKNWDWTTFQETAFSLYLKKIYIYSFFCCWSKCIYPRSKHFLVWRCPDIQNSIASSKVRRNSTQGQFKIIILSILTIMYLVLIEIWGYFTLGIKRSPYIKYIVLFSFTFPEQYRNECDR